MVTNDTGVLIIGAGPTGMVLALWLARLGVPVQIVDKAEQSASTSRALAVQARTLEFYQQLGIAAAVVEHGRQVRSANLWVGGRRAAHAAFADLGRGLSPFPYALIYPQDEHERMLVDRLADAGITVQRRTELVSFTEDDESVAATLKREDGEISTCRAAYIAGCDGAHSVVRQSLGIGFPGGLYSHLFYVADVEAGGAVLDGQLHLALDQSDFLVVFPLRGAGRARLIGTVRDEVGQARTDLCWEDVSQRVLAWLPVKVERVHWFSSYRVHHRVAGRFRSGRAFLLGDAAHIHSPVGGQGMNTGIGDAVNLAWKLAAVLQGRAQSSLLDSYQPERIAFARRLVATTDYAFSAVTSAGWFARFLRLRLAPLLVPAAIRLQAIRRLMFRTVSQTRIHYRASSLSAGHAGRIQGGDRLPWVPGPDEGADNFSPLASLNWQVHVYGAADDELTAWCREARLALHVFRWNAQTRRKGIRRNAVYLVRPDGYIALAAIRGAAAAIRSYVAARGLSFGATRPADAS